MNRIADVPAFNCPACGAKRVLFAGDKISKNETVLEQFREHGVADYVIICPKCRNYIAVRRQASKESAGLMFRTLPGTRAFGYVTVYNGRVRGIYHTKPHSELIFEGEYAPEHPTKEIPYARVIHAKTNSPQWYR